jgi:hypothetical protein
VLPKDLIHHCEPGSTLDRFFASWERYDDAARRLRQPRVLFAAEALAVDGIEVESWPSFARRGFLSVRSLTKRTALHAHATDENLYDETSDDSGA